MIKQHLMKLAESLFNMSVFNYGLLSDSCSLFCIYVCMFVFYMYVCILYFTCIQTSCSHVDFHSCKGWVPLVTNFCLWVTKKLTFFLIKLSAGHPGFHG